MAYNVLDISRYNSVSNYASVAESIDAAIIRIGYRSYSNTTLIKDSMFTSHYNSFVSAINDDSLNTELGLYWQINSITEDEAVEEADYVYNTVKDCSKLSCAFVLSQYGNDDHTGRADSLTNTERTKILVAFIERLKSFGLFHTVGIFMEEDWYDNNIDDTNPNTGNKLSDDYFLWIKNLDEQPQCKYNAWLYTDDDQEIVVGVLSQHDMSYFYDAAWKDPEPTETIDISLCVVSMDETEFEYTASAITPSINMAYNSELLDEGSDYTLSYENNINAGTATINITGIHEYSGTRSTTFTITKAKLQSVSVQSYDSTYTTKEINPSVIVKGVNDETLTVNTDYTTSYRDNINVGNGIVTVTPTENSNYTQDAPLETTYKITAMYLNECNIEGLEESYKYTGSAIVPTFSLYRTVGSEKITLTKDVDYTVIISNNTNIGTATITCRGFGNYTGSRIDTFKIVNLTIEGYTPTLSATEFVYDGAAHRPTVKLGNLSLGYHYRVEYGDDCVNVGGKTINIYGMGEYSGHLTATYYIEQKSISSMTLQFVEEVESFEYTSAAFTPEVYISGLRENRDYTLEYLNNIDPGQASIIATGTGNYIGTCTANFTILYRSIRDCVGKLGIPTTQSIYRINGQFYIYSVYPNIKLTEGTDYDILSQYTRSFDDFTLYSYKIKGMGFYYGTYIMRFRICNTEPILPGSKEDDGVYNFGDIDLGDETAVGYYDFYSLEPNDNDEYAANDEEESDESESNEVIYDINKADGDKDFDFEPMSLMLLSTYDIDDGFNINSDGSSEEEGGGSVTPARPDDGKYNFGDIDLGDETAEGDYDFGDLDEGVDEDSVASGNYDFNILSGDIEDYLTPGWEYILDKTPIYPNYDSYTSAFSRSGAYYVYKPEVKNNRVRLTRNEEAADCPVRATGWADVTVLKNLGKITVGTQVFATGRLYQYSNGTGNYIEVSSKGMYVTEVKETAEAKCPYGLALSYAGNTIGYAEEDMLTKSTDY